MMAKLIKVVFNKLVKEIIKNLTELIIEKGVKGLLASVKELFTPKRMRQIVKYPGSKWNIAPQLVELIPEHHSYVEPFFGSGAVLFNKPVSDIETINDLDHDVVNLFRCIQKDSERLARLVMTTPFSREEYERQFEGCTSTLYALSLIHI